jgi:hypothetical protein
LLVTSIFSSAIQSEQYKKLIDSARKLDFEVLNKSSTPFELSGVRANHNSKHLNVYIPFLSVNWDSGIKPVTYLKRNAFFIKTEGKTMGARELAEKEAQRVMRKYALDCCTEWYSAGEAPKYLIPELKKADYEGIKDSLKRSDNYKFESTLNLRMNSPAVSNYSITMPFPLQFEWVRSEHGMSRVEFAESLRFTITWVSSGGKSKSEFYKSKDCRYIAKIVPEADYVNFLNVGHQYFSYINYLKTNNLETLLSKILSAFKVEMTGFDKRGSASTFVKYVFISENLFFGLESKNLKLKVFDLKGSENNRKSNPAQSSTLLDTNFDLERNGDPVSFKHNPKFDFFEIAHRDCTLLRNLRLMDYSLLLILDVANKTARCGFIDYCRIYSFKENVEQGWKQVVRRAKDPTVVEPERYALRMFKSLKKRFVFFREHELAPNTKYEF